MLPRQWLPSRRRSFASCTPGQSLDGFVVAWALVDTPSGGAVALVVLLKRDEVSPGSIAITNLRSVRGCLT